MLLQFNKKKTVKSNQNVLFNTNNCNISNFKKTVCCQIRRSVSFQESFLLKDPCDHRLKIRILGLPADLTQRGIYAEAMLFTRKTTTVNLRDLYFNGGQ